jgi:curved DNA-binding protein CbpA
MIDYFAVLGESRRPWLDPEALKVKFLAFSAEVHPDRLRHATENRKRNATERYTELNAAYDCLRDPKDRLFHLLTLERGTTPEQVQRIGSEPMNLFNEVSQICRKADSFLIEKAKTTSPLLKAQILMQATELTDEISALRHELRVRRDTLVEQTKILNMAWESAPPVGTSSRVNFLPCGRLEQLYRDLSYVSRWLAQIEERSVQLSI